MKAIDKRLAALERVEQAQPQRTARFAADLLLTYGTPAEQEAADRPKTTRPEMQAALDLVYGAAPAASRPDSPTCRYHG